MDKDKDSSVEYSEDYIRYDSDEYIKYVKAIAATTPSLCDVDEEDLDSGGPHILQQGNAVYWTPVYPFHDKFGLLIKESEGLVGKLQSAEAALSQKHEGLLQIIGYDTKAVLVSIKGSGGMLSRTMGVTSRQVAQRFQPGEQFRVSSSVLSDAQIFARLIQRNFDDTLPVCKTFLEDITKEQLAMVDIDPLSKEPLTFASDVCFFMAPEANVPFFIPSAETNIHTKPIAVVGFPGNVDYRWIAYLRSKNPLIPDDVSDDALLLQIKKHYNSGLVKSASPGYCFTYPEPEDHPATYPSPIGATNASTLSGNSGSLVISLQDPETFYGIHFGGGAVNYTAFVSVHHKAFVMSYIKRVLPDFLRNPSWLSPNQLQKLQAYLQIHVQQVHLLAPEYITAFNLQYTASGLKLPPMAKGTGAPAVKPKTQP